MNNFESDIDFAKNVFKEKKELRPMFLMNTEKGLIPMVVHWNNNNEKRALFLAVRLAMIKYRVYSYTFMMEMWFKSVNSMAEHTKASVSEYSDKREGLLISYVSHDVKEMRIFEIKRDPIDLVEQPKMTDFHGMTFDLLPTQEQLAKELTPEQDEMLSLVLKLGGMQEVPLGTAVR